MSSSLRLNMASDEWAPFQPETTMTKPELGTSSGAKTRGRKTRNKGGTCAQNNAKKQPQRGLGVAQLERLRLQERWKKMTEMPHQLHSPPPPLQTLNFPAAAPADHHHFLMSHYYYQNTAHHHDHQEPLESVPVQYGAGSYGVAVNGSVAAAQCHGGTGRCLGMVHHHHQKLGHVAASGFVCGSSSSPSSPAAGVMDHRSVMVDPHHHQYCYGRGNGIDINGAPSPDHMFHHHETSKELSSMPKMQPCFVTSDLCSKKKRFNGGNIGGDRGDHKCPEILQFGGLNVLGSNSEYHVPNSTGSDQLTLGLGTTAARSIITNEGVEVVAVHRKGNSVSGGVVLMEYEFFPAKNDSCSSTGSKKASVSLMPGGEASYFDMISNPVDLSLKL
ncbi:NOZZLE transcription factor [Parasponia andersonii]|uniref:NOZZLE transcription factor n=1 Tax=Parasponia andersonii TaxID=3476 RepID=A0A2P5AP44_PARAD|nr:NOZZLE transcription factor [Parasponia andersonii]